jgi:hypothetical protein
MIGSIENSFSKIAKIKLSNVCSMGMQFKLFLTGDIKLTYVFARGKSGATIEQEFLRLLATASGGGIGDQVMIHMCNAIENFVLHNLTRRNQRNLTLTIDIDL